MATAPLARLRFLDLRAVLGVVLAVAALAGAFGRLPPVWVGAAAVLAGLLGYFARRRLLRPRQPTVDQVRSLVLSALAILLAMAGFALVAPALLVQAQQRLPH